MTDFERFREIVLNDAVMRERLLAETEVGAFVRLVIDLAAERGFALTGDEVHAAMEAESRSWTARQVR